jgi:hypothetical protein
MNINSGKPWSEIDDFDLKNSLAYGRSISEVADFLCRDEEEVRERAKQLNIKPQSTSGG